MPSKLELLEQIAADIVEHGICPDLAETASNLVMGEGDPDADIVLIGEAPGKREDETGRPFVGAAGRFLDVMLHSIELDRSDVYITNIVKYRPPDNRDPRKDEKAAFLPYLLRQLEVIRPKLVVTLGRHSLEYFMPGARIGQVHGQPQEVELAQSPLVVVPLFHPAAALYNGSLRKTLLEDFTLLPTLIDRIKQEGK